jgi:hypothetical protein
MGLIWQKSIFNAEAQRSKHSAKMSDAMESGSGQPHSKTQALLHDDSKIIMRGVSHISGKIVSSSLPLNVNEELRMMNEETQKQRLAGTLAPPA